MLTEECEGTVSNAVQIAASSALVEDSHLLTAQEKEVLAGPRTSLIQLTSNV